MLNISRLHALTVVGCVETSVGIWLAVQNISSTRLHGVAEGRQKITDHLRNTAADQSVAAAAQSETHNQFASVGSIKGGPSALHLGSPRRVHRCEYMQKCLGRR